MADDYDLEATGPDEARETERFVRRQRADAASSLRLAPPNLFRPRLSKRPAGVLVAAALLLLPLTLLPNPQDAAIAQNQAIREEAQHQAERIDHEQQRHRAAPLEPADVDPLVANDAGAAPRAKLRRMRRA